MSAAMLPAKKQAGVDCYSDFRYSEERMAALKERFKVAVEKFTFPVRVYDNTGACLAHNSCFSLYSNKTEFLATSRVVADALRRGP